MDEMPECCRDFLVIADLLELRSMPRSRRLGLTTLTTYVSNVVMKETTTLYLRGVPVRVAREAKAVAARRGSTLAALVSESLERSFGPDASTARATDDELEDDMRWFEASRARLLRKYSGQWVAIANHRVLDADDDFGALAERVFARGGVRPIYMPRVERGQTVVRIRSPRRVRG